MNSPIQIIQPFTTLYETRGWKKMDARNQIFFVGRLKVLHRSRGGFNADMVYFTDHNGYRQTTYHNVDGKPAYSDTGVDVEDTPSMLSWDVGGLCFYKQSATKRSMRLWLFGDKIFTPKSLETSDYRKAVALWLKTFGQDWVQSIAEDPAWNIRWREIATAANLRFEP